MWLFFFLFRGELSNFALSNLMRTDIILNIFSKQLFFIYLNNMLSMLYKYNINRINN